MRRDLQGMTFGRWTVLERAESKGAAKWICRCTCGTERPVAAKNLLAGLSTSCGCLTREHAAQAAMVDLKGQRFGRLTVLERAGKNDRGVGRWKCLCDCGTECTVLHSSLRTGKRTSCGCDSKKGKHAAKDIAGMRFGQLVALSPTEQRDRNGSIIWRCLCDCGKETDVSLDRLSRGSVISCGCMRERANREFGSKLTHVAGTSIDALRSTKLRADNSTGVTGVCRKRGRYEVNITFQRKMYYLGSYDRLETAVQVRRDAEELLHGNVLKFYEEWKRRADADPHWGDENPIAIKVRKTEDGAFRVDMLPHLKEKETEPLKDCGA